MTIYQKSADLKKKARKAIRESRVERAYVQVEVYEGEKEIDVSLVLEDGYGEFVFDEVTDRFQGCNDEAIEKAESKAEKVLERIKVWFENDFMYIKEDVEIKYLSS